MPSLANHQSNEFVKLLLLGDAKSGKTGSLVSLVKAYYRLFILDFDNLLDILAFLVKEQCPELLANVEYRTLRDKYKAGPTRAVLDGKATAWMTAMKMIDHWKYKEDGKEVDLGKPFEWGPDCILVIDSLSRLCDAAFAFHEVINTNPDQRSTYKNAQDDVEKFLGMLTSEHFTCNVIVICHGTFIDMEDGTTKIFPQGVGQKLSPKIPQYFPTYIRYKNQGGKRTIQTVSDAMIDLANTNPTAMAKTYPVETGLADIFAVLRDPPKVTKPTLVKKA